MKRVGILTFHRGLNYGAVLQTYALLTYLKKKDVDAFIIDRPNQKPTTSLYRRIYFALHPRLLINKIQWFPFRMFFKSNIKPISRKYQSMESIKKFQDIENCEVVIVGSDQVWRYEYSSVGFNYFFDFITSQNIKKVSYAASFGKDTWSQDSVITDKIRVLLNQFSAISVREDSGVMICEEIFGVAAKQVIDPTLLLSSEDYLTLIPKEIQGKKEKKKIVSYLLGKNPNSEYQACQKLAKQIGFDYIDLYQSVDSYRLYEVFTKGKRFFHVSVQNWIKEIYNAEFVVTNSYHGTIFSILFKKKFIVLNNISGGTSRIVSLLSILGLLNRFIVIDDDIYSVLCEEIDYTAVYSKLDIIRTSSTEFLRNNLTNNSLN